MMKNLRVLAILAAAVSIMTTPSLGQILDGGLPNAGFANLYAWYEGDSGLGLDGVAETPVWPEQTGKTERDIASAFGFGGPPNTITLTTVNNNQGALQFENIVTWAESADWGEINGDQTVFVVGSVNDITDAGFFGSNAGGSPTRVDATGGEWMVHGDLGSFSSGSVTAGELQAHSFVFKSNDVTEHYINGSLAGSGNVGNTWFSGFVFSGFQNAANTADNSTFGEILIYDTALSTADRQAVEGYLDDTYFGDVGVLCDADSDGDCELDDIAAMYAGTALSDLDGDGSAGVGDVQFWLAEASLPSNAANTTGATYKLGDVNLGGQVDSTDLGLLLNNFGTDAGSAAAGPGFAGGDLNLNGTVDSTDLGLLLNDFGFASIAAASVPEPASNILMLVAIMALCPHCFRRRRR